MGEKGFDKSNIESPVKYHSKNLSPWLLALATYCYQSLGQNWPKNKQEWIVFWLGGIVYIYGGLQTYASANKIVQ